jgi:SPP1 gp7 family putative phage head morphogenesis protein
MASLQGPQAVQAAVDAMRQDAAIHSLSYQSAVLADLGGQMFVRNVELAAPVAKLAAEEVPSFLRMPFDEALAFWVKAGGDPATLAKVLKAYRERSATSVQMQFDTVSAKAISEIERVLSQGGTLSDFKQAIESEAISLGIAPSAPGYLEMVYRTNVATAYGAGRYTQMNDPVVLSMRPYRQWRTVGDERVSDDHKLMHGVTWEASDPAFSNIAAPARFQCRCVTLSLSQRDIDARGTTISTAVPIGFSIYPGFGVSAFL